MTKTTDITTILFNRLMTHIRKNQTAQALAIIYKNPTLVNEPEKTLDMVSVGRFTTPYLLASTYNDNEFLKHILTVHKFNVNYLTQSHCGQQALAHAVVRPVNSEGEKNTQQETVSLLIKNAKKNLSPTEYKQFLLGGGEWERTPLYNSLEISKNLNAADIILNAIKDAGYIKEAREQRLQLNRPIYFYVNTSTQLDILLHDLDDSQKIQALRHLDDVGSNALHWAKTNDVADYIINKAPELAIATDYDGRTPAQTAYAAGRNDVSNFILQTTGTHKSIITQNIDKHKTEQVLKNALGNFINAVCFSLPVHSVIVQRLKNNLEKFEQGTQEFLISHGLHKIDDNPIQKPFKKFKNSHQFGLENEFHIPQQNEPLIKNLLTIFNRELSEPYKEILKFVQDPEPSVLPNAPDGVAVEIVSPIIRNQNTADKFYQICDIAKDLGAQKNATSGIHVHVGCQNHITKKNQSLEKISNATDAEIQMAFLKTFLHVIQEARPVFDNFCRSKDRPDYPKKWDLTGTPEEAKQDYYNMVDNLTDFAQLPEFTTNIGRGKYVLAAPPKDNKGTIEIRELKNSQTNATGMNNDEVKNIFDFVHKLADITTQIIQNNPPQAGTIYKPTLNNNNLSTITGEAVIFAKNTSAKLTKITPQIKAIPQRHDAIKILHKDISNSIRHIF